MEEAVEIVDRRAGRDPATDHDPLDFLMSKPDYDGITETQNFRKHQSDLKDVFPPLSKAQAHALKPIEVLMQLRQRAREPWPDRSVGCEDECEREALRFAVWCQVCMAPKPFRDQMMAGTAGVQLIMLCPSKRTPHASHVVLQNTCCLYWPLLGEVITVHVSM